MATDDIQRLVTGSASAPATFKIPGNGQMRPKAIYASFDGTGAAGAFKPALKITSDAGELVGIYATDDEVAAGASATVSWFPGGGLGGGATGPGSLPVAFMDTTTQLSLTAWGGIYTPVTWTLFSTGDSSTFSWPSGADATKVHLATAGVYRFVYVYQVDGLNFPVAGNQILSTVAVSVVGATTQTLSLDRTTGALYRGDPSVGTPHGATGERVFNIGAAQDVSLYVAYNGAGTLKLDTIVAFIYKIGEL